MHAHDAWTLLLVDRGAVRYQLEGREHVARPGVVTLLPPRVPHDGAAAGGTGFRKRVLYLESASLPAALGAAAARNPGKLSQPLCLRVSALHAALDGRSDRFAAEQRLVGILATVQRAWLPDADPAAAAATRTGGRLAERLRDLLEADVTAGVTLQAASTALDASRSSLVHAFHRRFGMSPHRYVISRRLDVARALLLAGAPAAEAAVLAGFHDQAHLTRHFKRLLGVAPGAWASARR